MQVLRTPAGTPLQDANGQEEGEEGEEGEEEEEEEGQELHGIREVTWSAPDGFKVAAEPEKHEKRSVVRHGGNENGAWEE